MQHGLKYNDLNDLIFEWCVCVRVCVCVYLVLLVLPGVGEAGDDSGDAGRGGDLAGVDHDEQLHQVVVNFAAAALHDVHVLAAHALPDFHTVWTTGRETRQRLVAHVSKNDHHIEIPLQCWLLTHFATQIKMSNSLLLRSNETFMSSLCSPTQIRPV